MGAELTCLNCIHYAESRRECHGWDRPAPVDDPAATAGRCRRYTDVYGREVEFVEGEAQFKQAADPLETAKGVVKAAITAKQEVDAVAQTAQATHERPRRRLPLRRPDVSDEQIRELWQQGKSIKAIARTVNMSEPAIRKRLHRLGLRPPAGSRAQPEPREIRVTVTHGRIAVDIRTLDGATLDELLEVLSAVGGQVPAKWRVYPVQMRLHQTRGGA